MTTESFRKDIQKKLFDLQGSDDQTAVVSFPSNLTSSDRKYIHQIAQGFGLPTQSNGVGTERCISVYKTPPEGHVARRELSARGGSAIGVPASLQQELLQVSQAAPPSTGRVALANVRAKSRMGASAARRLVEGAEVQGYWPDDDTWLEASIATVYEDGSFRIIWADDASESDVPQDYVRAGGAAAASAPEMCLSTLEQALDARRALPGYAKFLHKEELPGFKMRESVVETIGRSQVVLLSGETGCGKSTQVPQHILDSCPNAKILVMQPRKLAAVTLAERIAAERCQPLGRDVGYDVPFGTKGHHANLIFCTLGVMRRRLLNDPDLKGITHVVFDEVHERDKLADFNMIFMRDLLSRRPELRLVLMSATLQMETFEAYFAGAGKIEIPGRVFPVSELYLDEIVATLYKQPMFRLWLGPGVLCGGIHLPTFGEGDWNEREWKKIVFQHTKPDDKESLWGLKEQGLEDQMLHKSQISKAKLQDGLRKHDVLQQSSLAFDYSIIEALLLHIDRMYRDQHKREEAAGDDHKPPGTVLVFLPGWGDIDQLKKRLVTNFDANRFKILALHSQVTSEEQNEVFLPADTGVRKIVLTTNIAEASITVEGTEFVIDSARAKEVSYDPYLNIGTLTTSWISQASAKQRAGRAGRTQGGLCFHLMCRERFDKLDEFLPPELLRSPLEDSALTAKLMLMQMGSTEKVSDFLMKAPTPPEEKAVQNSIEQLKELGALYGPQQQLTALGEHLTKSALPPRLAKTVLWAILFGCLDDALCVVAAASGHTRDPFRMSGKSREEAQEMRRALCAPQNSDHACLLAAVNGYADAADQRGFCDKWSLAEPSMRQIRDQQNRIFAELKENKSEGFANRNRGNFELLVAVLCAGIFPNIAVRRGNSDDFTTQGGKVNARVHGASSYIPDEPDQWVIYQELSQMEANYRLKLCSPVKPLVLLLLGGEGKIAIEEGKGKGKGKGKDDSATVSLLNGWCKFKVEKPQADAIQSLRASLQSIFQAFCQRPDMVPPANHLAALDGVANIVSQLDGGGGVKRPAPTGADGQPLNKLRIALGSKGKGKVSSAATMKGAMKGAKGKGKWRY